jgi:predicted transcriptional regulator
MNRTLTITIRADWKAALRDVIAIARTGIEREVYMGETLNFETPSAFFSRLTPNRWTMLTTLQGAAAVGVRELARRLNRDVKRVHEDAAALIDLGLVERGESGKLVCPYADIHVDMHVMRQAA